MQLGFPRKYVSSYKGFFRDLFFGNEMNSQTVKEFENSFAAYIGTPYALSVSSARWGLYLILKNLDLKPLDEVIIPALTHSSIPLMIKKAGALPIYIDTEKDSPNLDIEILKKNITDKTKIIIATHLFGIPCNLTELAKICAEYNIILLEDCAHAVGIKLEDKMAGSLGTASFFSFDTTKQLNTLGGGMIVTRDKALYEKLKNTIHAYPLSSKKIILPKLLKLLLHKLYTNRIFFTFFILPVLIILNRLDLDLIHAYKKQRKIKLNTYETQISPLQAYLGLKQLKKIETNNQKIHQHLSLLREKLSPAFKLTKLPQKTFALEYLLSLRVENKKLFYSQLLNKKIDSDTHILSLNYSLLKDYQGFPQAQNFLKHALQISINSGLKEQDILYLAESLNKTAAKIEKQKT